MKSGAHELFARGDLASARRRLLELSSPSAGQIELMAAINYMEGGIFPKLLTRRRTIGFPLGGLVSHNFLRHYRWTLDFDQMTMSLDE